METVTLAHPCTETGPVGARAWRDLRAPECLRAALLAAGWQVDDFWEQEANGERRVRTVERWCRPGAGAAVHHINDDAGYGWGRFEVSFARPVDCRTALSSPALEAFALALGAAPRDPLAVYHRERHGIALPDAWSFSWRLNARR